MALELAATTETLFPDGVVLVELAAVRDAEAMSDEICRAADRRARRSRRDARLHEVLRERRMLLLLDNVEQVSEADTLIPTLSGTCRGVAMLITSLRTLRMAGECVLHLTPLAVPPADVGAELPRNSLQCNCLRSGKRVPAGL